VERTAVMAAKVKTISPSKQFAELLPKITTRELYGVAVAIMSEGAARAENYADAAWADEAPREIAEEGLAFVTKFDGLWSWPLGSSGPQRAAKRLLADSASDLKNAWEDEGTTGDEDGDEEDKS
jgi:hypothetical protein